MGEFVRMRDTGDGGRAADTSNIGKCQVKTANYTVRSYESEGFIFSNLGATGAVTFTVPAPKAGRRLIFLRETIAQNIVITTGAGGAQIRLGSSTGTTATCSAAGEYSSVELLGSGTAWFCRGNQATVVIS